MYKFGLIGAAGYVAPRHMQAIKDTGNELIVALDPHDSVGVLDRHFPNCEFFTDTNRFDRHIMRLPEDDRPDYISVCSPNYLHESHCKLGLRLGANIICEKPLLLSPTNISQLEEVAQKFERKVYTILQLRLHPSIRVVKKLIDPERRYKITLDYITPRGPWYFHSWKGREGQSGGIETNIGIHFFDMLMWIFGKCKKFKVEYRDEKTSKGTLTLERADVNWFLSLDRKQLPQKGLKFYRSMKIDGEEIRFDNVFSDLHTESYQHILDGNGFCMKEAYDSIDLTTRIREAT